MKTVATFSFLVAGCLSVALADDDLTVRIRIPNGLPKDGADCTEPEKQLLLKVASEALMTQSSRTFYDTQDNAFCRNLCLPAGRPGQFCTAVEKRCNKNQRDRFLRETEPSAGDMPVGTTTKFRILEELPDFMKEFFGFGSFGGEFDYSFSGGDSTDTQSSGFPSDPFSDTSSDASATGFDVDQTDHFSFQSSDSLVPSDTDGDPSLVAFDTSVDGDLLLQQQCSDLRDLIIEAVTLGTIGDLSPKCEQLVAQKFAYECFTTGSLE